MYRVLRSIAFRFDAERVHRVALRAHSLRRSPLRRQTGSPRVVMGLKFPNVVGLAAGYDKDARAWRGLAGSGFGHIEVGTVTPKPQPGNRRPRLFRLPDDGALINRMGFPSEGAEAVASRLGASRPGGLVLGVSIGPNVFGELNRAASQYEDLVDRFAPLADYLAINVSSPNTRGLRALETGGTLRELLNRISARRDRHAGEGGRRVPLVVKLSPDIPVARLAETTRIVEATGIDGIIVTNTTKQRPSLRSARGGESGGLSGSPLRPLSLEVLQRVREATELPLIASGGVMTPADAMQRLAAGACLVQLFTGFVYHGARLVRAIAQLPEACQAGSEESEQRAR